MFWRTRKLYSPDGGGGDGGKDDGADGADTGNGGDDKNGGSLIKLVDTEGNEVIMTHEEVQQKLVEAAEAKAKADEAIARAKEKEKGADAKLRESASDRTLRKLLREAKEGSLDAYERLSKEYPETGITEEHVREARRMAKEGASDEEGNRHQIRDDTPVTYEDLAPAVRKDLEDFKALRAKQKVDGILATLDAQLDKDAHIGDIIRNKEFSKVAKHAKEKALGVLHRRAGQNRSKGPDWEPSPEDYRDALQAARTFLMDLGYLADPENKDAGAGRPPVPTLGRSPSVPTSLYRNKEPLKRPNAAEGAGAYDEYVMQRLGQLQDELSD